MSELTVEITKDNLDPLLKKNGLAAVDCWANWCGPCRALAPMFERLATKYRGKMLFGKMDCDKNPELVKRFEIMAIPTILFFQEGQLKDTVVGLVDEYELEDHVKKLL